MPCMTSPLLHRHMENCQPADVHKKDHAAEPSDFLEASDVSQAKDCAPDIADTDR